mmetsp:Transcript_72716/g.171039  ORF Transcript_72716/g.171039 Transcript_72716/m.171039 type:complete len:274 (+) Transcript_72716:903-1724(+)
MPRKRRRRPRRALTLRRKLRRVRRRRRRVRRRALLRRMRRLIARKRRRVLLPVCALRRMRWRRVVRRRLLNTERNLRRSCRRTEANRCLVLVCLDSRRICLVRRFWSRRCRLVIDRNSERVVWRRSMAAVCFCLRASLRASRRATRLVCARAACRPRLFNISFTLVNERLMILRLRRDALPARLDSRRSSLRALLAWRETTFELRRVERRVTARIRSPCLRASLEACDILGRAAFRSAARSRRAMDRTWSRVRAASRRMERAAAASFAASALN